MGDFPSHDFLQLSSRMETGWVLRYFPFLLLHLSAFINNQKWKFRKLETSYPPRLSVYDEQLIENVREVERIDFNFLLAFSSVILYKSISSREIFWGFLPNGAENLWRNPFFFSSIIISLVYMMSRSSKYYECCAWMEHCEIKTETNKTRSEAFKMKMWNGKSYDIILNSWKQQRQ